MTVQDIIEYKLKQKFDLVFLQVENESDKHGGPATESHYKLTIVSERFEPMKLVQRHREIYQLLSEELDGGVHALALHVYSPSEWQSRNSNAPKSPDCQGGSLRDH